MVFVEGAARSGAAKLRLLLLPPSIVNARAEKELTRAFSGKKIRRKREFALRWRERGKLARFRAAIAGRFDSHLRSTAFLRPA
jgi:hypothetical protein